MIGSKNIHNLPLPRLEFNLRKNNDKWSEMFCDYFLVLPIDDLDIRSNTNDSCDVYNEWKVLIGQTRRSGNDEKPLEKDGSVQTPFRDFIHMQIDSESLGGLPRFAVCEDVFSEIKKS